MHGRVGRFTHGREKEATQEAQVLLHSRRSQGPRQARLWQAQLATRGQRGLEVQEGQEALLQKEARHLTTNGVCV